MGGLYLRLRLVLASRMLRARRLLALSMTKWVVWVAVVLVVPRLTPWEPIEVFLAILGLPRVIGGFTVGGGA
ncbi:MAG: hypothetical protein ACI9KE_003427 [Polyangiales bacterium]|jgi:hypothetical protein